MGVGGGYHEDCEEFLVLATQLNIGLLGVLQRSRLDRNYVPVGKLQGDYSCLLHRCQ